MPLLLPRFLVDQNSLLPFARLFVGAMNATCPATRAFSTFDKLFNCSPDPSRASLVLLRVFDPANELITSNWRQAFP